MLKNFPQMNDTQNFTLSVSFLYITIHTKIFNTKNFQMMVIHFTNLANSINKVAG